MKQYEQDLYTMIRGARWVKEIMQVKRASGQGLTLEEASRVINFAQAIEYGEFDYLRKVKRLLDNETQRIDGAGIAEQYAELL